MRGFFSFFGYNEIRSMSGRYASYWNAFLSILFPQNGGTWNAVGHTDISNPGVGNLNNFGRAFQSAGFVSLTIVIY